MNLTLRQLRAFDAVAETGSFTAAAARLHLTQSALSVLVRELEREMGVQLFDRHTRRVLLSEAGREFQPSVQRLLSLLAALSKTTDLAIGCYCEDESQCHRSLLAELLREKGADLSSRA